MDSCADAGQSPRADGRLWYFAYGSNLNSAIFIERRRMHPVARRRAWLDHYRLCFNIPVGPGERAVANLAAHTGARTHGLLYLLDADELDHLDRTEGVHLGIYRRLSVEVVAESDERLLALTYQSELIQDGRKPSARYLGLLVTGARQHGLPEEYVRFLESFELAVDERTDRGGDPT